MASNTPRLILQDKNVKIPLNTDLPIELSPGSPVLSKTPTTKENHTEKFTYIQSQIDRLIDELESNAASHKKFKNDIEKTITNAEIYKRDAEEILFERITILETENKCLKNEIKNQKEIIQVLLSDGKNERWVKQNKRSSANQNEVKMTTPVNLQNRFQTLEEPERNTEITPKNSLESIPKLPNTKSKSKQEKKNTNSIRQTELQKERRPNICTTENYLNNQVDLRQNPRVVPGNRTYASATKYGKKVMVLGDSHTKRIKRNLFNNSFDNAKTYIKSFSGARTNDMKHYAIPSLNDQNPDIVVIHIGGNDITHKNKETVIVEDLAKDIIDLGNLCRESGVPNVLISEILPKRSIILTKIIRKVNDRLEELCKINNFHLISHRDISRDLLCHDGIHLTDSGTDILADDIVDFINYFILSSNVNCNRKF